MSENNLQKMAIALADVEAELIRRRQEGEVASPDDVSDEFLDMFDDIDGDEDELFYDEVDNEDD